ncbi:SMP-30/gluconolactonase/LRE family protein [Jannaschia faecimaris]|uniref:SMP-30/gluconolactonase/LRE family protein n=1 Tax=Jannaschia faecimaris TaxID=1244108 RepID=UPI003CC79D49
MRRRAVECRQPAEPASGTAARIRRLRPRGGDGDLPDRDGRGITRVPTEADAADPNGLCFWPDHKTLYIASTGKGPRDAGPGGQGEVIALDVADDGTSSNQRVFSDCEVDGVKCGPDGLRTDVAGNLWESSNAGATWATRALRSGPRTARC